MRLALSLRRFGIIAGIAVALTGEPATADAQTFTDDPLVAGASAIRVLHITELRSSIDSLRVAKGLAAFNWTDATLTAGVTEVRVVHLTQLRAALNDVYVAGGAAVPTYTDPSITAGQTPIKAVHLNELRAAVRAAPSCTYTLTPATTTIDFKKQSVYFTLTTGSSCTWSAPATAGFLTRTSAASGTGSASSISYQASENNVPSERSTPVTIAGRTATVTQTAPGPVTRLEMQPDHLSPQVVGTRVKWTAIATGGAAPLSYRWIVYDRGSAVLTQDWTPNAETFFWSPQAASNEYQVRVWARSPWVTSTDGELSASSGYSVTASNAPGRITGLTLTSDRSSPQVLGTTITWTATPSGGTAPYSYKWWVSDNGTESWSLLQDWTSSGATRTWTPTIVRNRYWIAVWVRSSGSGADSPEQALHVPFAIVGSAGQNEPPLVTALPNQGNVIGATVRIPIGAADIEKAPLSYSLSGQPPGVSVDAATGIISGTIGGAPATYTVTATVSDGVHGVSQTFTWDVGASLSTGVVVSDQFTAANPVVLTGHPPDLAPAGSAWKRIDGAAAATVENGRLRLGSATGYEIFGIESRVAEGRVGVDIVSPSTSTIYGGLVFLQRNSSVMVLLAYRGTAASGVVGLYRRDGANVQTIYEQPVTALPANTVGRLAANFNGPWIEAMWNGTALFQRTVANFAPSTTHGIVWHSDDPLAQFDRFEVSFPPGAPIITSPSNQVHEENWTVSMRVAATDPQRESIGFSAVGLPAGMSIDASTGLIWGRLSSDSAAIHNVVVRAIAGGRSSQRSFQWLVRCPPADYQVSPSHLALPAAGGTFVASVTASAGCPWEATSEFVQLTGEHVRDGNGTPQEAQFWINNNPSPSPQAGLLTLAGQGVVLTQHGEDGHTCTFAVEPSRLNLNADDSGATTISFTSADTSCQWAVSKRGSWISVSGPTTGTGDGSIVVRVDRNLGSSIRNGYLQVGSTEVVIEQASSGPPGVPGICTFAISGSPTVFASGAAMGSILISTQAGCSWSASEESAFVTVVSGGSGSGPGSLVYSIEANATVQSRAAAFTVAGQTFSITQVGEGSGPPPCLASVAQSDLIVLYQSGAWETDVIVGTSCSWTAASDVPWLIVWTNNGTGPGSMSYAVLENDSTSGRTGHIVVGGAVITVQQDPNNTTSSLSEGLRCETIITCREAECGWDDQQKVCWDEGPRPRPLPVLRKVRVKLAAFIPDEFLEAPPNLTPDPIANGGFNRLYEGDGRGFSPLSGRARVEQVLDIWNPMFSRNSIPQVLPSIGMSVEYEKSTSVDGSGVRLTAEAKSDWLWDTPKKTRWLTAADDTTCESVQTSGSLVRVACIVDVGIPLAFPSPDIEWRYEVEVDFYRDEAGYFIKGCHKYFPAYEIWVNGAGVELEPRASDARYLLLPCSLSRNLSVAGVVP